MFLAPLSAFVMPIILLYAVLYVYRLVYPYEKVREALEVLAEYRVLSRMGGKRYAKRARQLAPRARAARRLLAKALALKMALVAAAFTSSMMLVFRVPVAPSPYALPPIAAVAHGPEGDVAVAYLPMIHFLGYIYALLLYRDAMT